MNLVINAQLHRTQQSASLILISRYAPKRRVNLVRGAVRGHGRQRGDAATGKGCSCWPSARGEAAAAAGGPDTAPRGSSTRLVLGLESPPPSAAESSQAAQRPGRLPEA